MPGSQKPVLILGAGINGAALARELLVNRVPVVLVDTADLSTGATAYSSRLIHGGLRYLEYGEFSLVRESLAERTRLLRLAPHLVHPLELWIPTSNRTQGAAAAVGRFLGWPWWPTTKTSAHDRGAWLIRAGLWFYDTYARDPTLPRHGCHTVQAHMGPPVDEQRYRWVCSYYDAQVTFPERMVVAQLSDARQLAEAAGVEFSVWTYHAARLVGSDVEIHPVADPSAVVARCSPSVIINATGAWVDHTLAALPVPSKRLMGGTKGSHLLTYHAGLQAALGGRGIYAEARDGRPIFILPLAGTTLIGTTDLPFEGNPASAVATESEREYLLDAVRSIFPQFSLTAADVAFHYSGVRPLPHVAQGSTAAITRRHWLERNTAGPLPVYSIIGGKLTTCRSLAEESVHAIAQDLGWTVTSNTGERPLPGGESYPANETSLEVVQRQISEDLDLPLEAVRAVWTLCGSRTREILTSATSNAATSGTRSATQGIDRRELLPGTMLPCSLARWMIQHEWVSRLDDLVERRLMLLYHHPLSRVCLRRLAMLLVEAGRLLLRDVDNQVQATCTRLRQHFGKTVIDE